MCPQILEPAMNRFPSQNTLQLHPKLKPDLPGTLQGPAHIQSVLPPVHPMGRVSGCVTPQRGWEQGKLGQASPVPGPTWC